MGWLYSTRGCTLFPDRGLHSCCLEHDAAYARQAESRFVADNELLACGVAAGYPYRAIVAFLLLRAFGWIRWHWIRLRRKRRTE